MIWHILSVYDDADDSRDVTLGVAVDVRKLGICAVAPYDMLPDETTKTRRMKARAIMPGYVLTGFRDDDDWPAILKIKYTRDFLRLAGSDRPIVIPQELVYIIKNWPVELANMRRQHEAQRVLTIGRRVEITEGPGASWHGIVSKLRGGNALLDIIGMAKPVTVPTKRLRLVEYDQQRPPQAA